MFCGLVDIVLKYSMFQVVLQKWTPKGWGKTTQLLLSSCLC